MEGRDSNNSSDVKAEVPFDSSENTGVSSVIVKDEMLPDVVKSESNENTPDINAESDGNHPEYTDCTATQFCFVGIKTEMPDDYESDFESESLESKYLSEEHSTNLKHKSSVSDERLEETEPTNHSSPGVDVKIEIEEDMDKCESDLESYEEGLVKIDSNGSMDSNSEPNACNERGHSSQEFIRGIECQEYPILCVKDEGKMDKQFGYMAEIDTACASNASFTCAACGAAFVEKSSLARHLRVHTGLKPFACPRPDCCAAFAQRSHLANHLASHSERRLFSCGACGAAFKHKTTLLSHARTTHAGERPHACEVCGARFARKAHLDGHRVKHTGLKPFACPDPGCEAAFGEKGSLTKHLRIHTGEKPFACPWPGCGAAFRHNSTRLRSHLRTHSAD